MYKAASLAQYSIVMTELNKIFNMNFYVLYYDFSCHNGFLESCIAYTLPIILSHQHLSEKWQSFSPEVSIWCEKGQKKRVTHEQVMIIMQGNIQ